MGDGLVTSGHPLGSGVNDSAPIFYTDIFYEQLPYYLSIGMSWDEYWHDDPSKAKYYRQADKLRRKRKNEELWLQGMYIYEAIGDMSPILRTSFDKKPKKPIEYPKEPYAIESDEIAERKKRDEKRKSEAIKNKMIAFALRQNNRMNKGGESNG